jgi:hypothetical protein
MTPAGLAYLGMPLSGTFSMIPTLFCRSASRRIPANFEPASRAAIFIAHAAFVNRHIRKGDEGRLVCDGPTYGSGEIVDALPLQ